MARKPSTTTGGQSFSAAWVEAVWQKGAVVPGYDPAKFRKDRCAMWMQRDLYGVRAEGGMGWEIDHDKPVAKGGTDDFANLQPLNWRNNAAKSDNYPHWTCAVRAQ